MKKELCLEKDCNAPVAWVRCTQFSGDHYFCEIHALLETDFLKQDDSYFYWKKIEQG